MSSSNSQDISEDIEVPEITQIGPKLRKSRGSVWIKQELPPDGPISQLSLNHSLDGNN